VPDSQQHKPISLRLKGNLGESHTGERKLIALVKLLARRAAEEDFKRQMRRPDPAPKEQKCL